MILGKPPSIFGHEFRACMMSIVPIFFITGIIDVAFDWVTKAFLWTMVAFSAGIFWSFELMFYETPKHPFIESIIFTTAIITGAFSIHGMTWLALITMLGMNIIEPVWLAPNIYIQNVGNFYLLTGLCLAIYLVLLFYTLWKGTVEEKRRKRI